MFCNENLAFFCNCATTLEGSRLWAHERTPGIPRNVENLETIEFADVLGAIAEDFHSTRCAQVCFTGTEEDQAEQHDQGTIDDILGDQDMKQGKDVLEEADREADLLEQIPLPGHPESEKERLASWLRLLRRARVAIKMITSKLATSTSRSTCADATSCSSTTRLHQCSEDISMSGMRQHKAEPSNTQRITTSTLHVQSRSGSRCVRDR